jgi:hypothetical protein
MSSPAIERPSNQPPAEDIPHYQPWLGVSCSAFVPCVLMFILPQGFLIPMIVLAAALMGAGIIMLFRQEARSGTKR